MRRSVLQAHQMTPLGSRIGPRTVTKAIHVVSLVSVFARLGSDPWLEAGRLAKLPKSEATESLARSIASMPTSLWPLQAATAIAPPA